MGQFLSCGGGGGGGGERGGLQVKQYKKGLFKRTFQQIVEAERKSVALNMELEPATSR